MQFECDCTIFKIFFPSLSLREFPCEQNFLPGIKFYTKAYEQGKVLRKTQTIGHIWLDFMQT